MMPVARSHAVLASLCALIGVPLLLGSFALNPGPPPGLPLPQLVAFGVQHRSAVLLAGWMQATGTLLAVVFALALLHFAQAGGRLAGSLSVFGSAVLMVVGLIEVMLYVGLISGDPATVEVAAQLIPGLQHAYPIVAAPMVFLPLSAAVLRARLLPAAIGQLGFALGAIFWLLGLLGVLYPMQGAVDVLSAVQGLWWLAAAAVTLARGLRGTLGQDPLAAPASTSR